MEQTAKPRLRWPMIAMTVVGIIALIVAGIAYSRRQDRLRQEEEAQAMFKPAMDAIEKTTPEVVDIDRTVQVIHGLDRALEGQGSLQDYLRHMAAQDYSGVAPDVLAARGEVMDILRRLYAAQSRLENQEATFTATRTLLSAMSLMKADVDIMSGVMPSLDAEQARSVLEDLRKDQAIRKELLDELADLEVELIAVMTRYSATYYKHIAEWDRLVLLRDRAYLAAADGQWGPALAAAQQAMEKAPHETEAHLLAARALIALDNQGESQHLQQAVELLNTYVNEHPDRSAPAMLLLGVAYQKMGQTDQARLSFQHAATYYPKQADVLSDMLDPYTVRAFLRKSREGRVILDQYSSTMLGAGYFSPELQMARIFFEQGMVDEGRKRVLDHFSRRRNQQRWDLVLSDLEFCESYLGPHFEKLFIEDAHMFLETSPTLIGSKLDVKVRNETPGQLLNATLLLAVRFTDMHREDFEVFKVGETVPVVAPHAATNFGALPVEFDLFGQTRGVDDIVLARAILLTDDAVVWVDTDAHRLALARTAEAPLEAAQKTSWFDVMKIDPNALQTQLLKSAVDLNLTLGKDDISLQLPKEIAILKPTFRLHDQNSEQAPSTNRLTKDTVELKFPGVRNFEDKETSPSHPVLKAHTRFGDFDIVIDWQNRRIADVRFSAR